MEQKTAKAIKVHLSSIDYHVLELLIQEGTAQRLSVDRIRRDLVNIRDIIDHVSFDVV